MFRSIFKPLPAYPCYVPTKRGMPSSCTSNGSQRYGVLEPPPETSTLTAWATDDLDTEPWVTLYEERLSFPPSSFWYVIDLITTENHWNRTIYAQSILRSEHVHVQPQHTTPDPYTAPPPPGVRVHALRKLSRKTPAPVGGTPENNGRAYDAFEWTCQWAENGHGNKYGDEQDHDHEHAHDENDTAEECRRHVACFGLCIPTHIVTPDNPRAQRYWPFQYPKTRCYRFVYEKTKRSRTSEVSLSNHDNDGENDNNPGSRAKSTIQADVGGEWVLRYEVVPLGDEARSPRQFETLVRHARPAAIKMVTHVRKRMSKYDVDLGVSTYVKRVTHDNLISEVRYRRWYDGMKVRHAPQIQEWTRTPDLLLKPYEELSIAAYLCALWEAEREQEDMSHKQKFVDVGCGNGLLVYFLLLEGHTGIGVDLQKRPIWDLYPSSVRQCLRHEVIDPIKFDCTSYDWIVGNHSDELSPWVPVMAARAQKQLQLRKPCHSPPHSIDGDIHNGTMLRRAYPRFFLLPCCFFDFDGKKVAFGHTRRTIAVRAPHGMGKYEQYYRWIDKIMRTFGFTVEYENLRIPSTKYVCLMGRFVQYEERITAAVIKEMTSLVLLDAQQSRM